MKQKLAIVGSGPKSRDQAPWNDPEYDIWVFNEATESPWVKRYDASFQMHKAESYTAPENFKCKNYWQVMQEKRCKPIFMQEPDDRVPDCEVYPLDEITRMTGLTKPFLTGTPAMALALGIYKGYATIDIYGIEMSYTEYKYQAECWRYWVGFAHGRGIKVGLYSGGHMFDAKLYGYEGNHTFPASHFQGRADKIKAEFDAAYKNLQGQIATVKKCLADDEYLKVNEKVGPMQAAAMLAGELKGRLQEAELYAGYTVDKPADRGEFEFRAALNQRDGEPKRIAMQRLTGQIEYVWNVWNQTKQPGARVQLEQMIERLVLASLEVAAMWGAYQENISYIAEYDDMYIAAGGQIGDNPRNVRLG